jgi:hypothetical protein
VETPSKSYSATLYADNESTDALLSYSLTLDKASFAIAELSIAGAFLPASEEFQTVTGQWETFVYTFTISSGTKARLSLIDSSSGAFVTVNFVKDIDRRPLPWYRAYGLQILMFGGFIISQIVSYRYQSKMAAERAPEEAAKRRAAAMQLAAEKAEGATSEEDEGEEEEAAGKADEANKEGDPVRRKVEEVTEEATEQ